MDPVHGGGPWTGDPCFVLSPCGQWIKTDQTDNKARVFWGNIVKTKIQSLAFMQLVPGAESGPPYLHSMSTVVV